MRSTEPWQTAEIAGPKKALIITKPEIVTAIIKKAKLPILIVGYEATEIMLGGATLIDYLVKLAKITDIPIVATAHVLGEFLKRDFQPRAWMPVVDIANRLQDPNWQGLDGKGQYDLVLLTGIPYYMEWLILSSLKHFASGIKTISLDRFYQPHASWSFPNISLEEWKKNLSVIENKLRVGEKYVHV